MMFFPDFFRESSFHALYADIFIRQDVDWMD